MEQKDKLNVAIIDADLIGRNKHRFPNLACMKLSAYYKEQGDCVVLKQNYSNLDMYDKVFISKVFMDTEIPNEPNDKSLKKECTISEFYSDNTLLNQPNVEYGGTGFFYDKAMPFPEEIEHIMPDYHLYDKWVEKNIKETIKARQEKIAKELTKKQIEAIEKDFTYFTNYSIGFTTRGCIRRCKFCVNKNYTKCVLHSPVSEFLNKKRKYICLLDDNVFACKDWANVFNDLQNTDKQFQFKQGLDERLLTEEKCQVLFNKSKWVGDYIFAFDNLNDAEIIEEKLKLIRKHTNAVPKFYTFCGFNHNDPDQYNEYFWSNDIFDIFKRIAILMKYKCLPYIMRYKDYELSPYRGIYINLARWCNQPNFFKKMSFRQFCEANGLDSSCYKYLVEFETKYPEIKVYFDMIFNNTKFINNKAS
jgi:hypothetical protein